MSRRPARVVRAILIVLLVLTLIGAAAWYFELPRRMTDQAYSYLESRKMEAAPLRYVSHGAWLELQPGIELRELEFARKGRWLSTFNLVVLRVDPKRVWLRMVAVSPEELPTSDIETLARRTNALALLNTNYFEPDSKVMGLVIAEGKTIYPLRKEGSIHHGVWFLKNGEAFVVHRTVFDGRGVNEAFQAGPWLVTDGEPETRFRNAPLVARRSAVGVDRKGRVLLMATDALLGGLSLPELAAVLGTAETKGGLGLWRAINCDGGTSTQMVIRHSRASVVIRSTVRVPVCLGVYPR